MTTLVVLGGFQIVSFVCVRLDGGSMTSAESHGSVISGVCAPRVANFPEAHDDLRTMDHLI